MRAGVSKAERAVQAAERRLKDAEQEVRSARAALEEARVAAAAVEGSPQEVASESESESHSADVSNGCEWERVAQETILWSHKVKCEAGVRVFAQYGTDQDELWFRATVIGVLRNDVGQWVDVQYDDGDVEKMKPIKRVRALDDSSSSEDDDDDDDE